MLRPQRTVIALADLADHVGGIRPGRQGEHDAKVRPPLILSGLERRFVKGHAQRAAGPVELNPRLDAICIANSFMFVPSDAIAERELEIP